MIDRALIEDMFDGIRARGAWDLNGPLLWGFFFTDDNLERLEAAAQALVDDGYALVGIFQPQGDDGEDLDYLFMHVERVEHLTVDSLDRRNAELSQFAEQHGLRTYDGMDVGPAP